MHKQLPKEYYEVLYNLQSVDFALVDLTLYLDTHPYDVETIKQYNELAKQRKVIAKQFESQFGPLCEYGKSYVGYPFSWNECPWPWQV